MTGRLLKMLIPAGLIATVFGAGAGAQRAGWIPEHIAHWLWPLLVLLVLIGFATFTLLKRHRVLLIPLGLGALTQLFGLILLLVEVFESTWEPTIYTLLVMLAVVLVMLTVWGINTVRSRILERKLAEGLAVGVDGNQEQLGRIREDMMQALTLLKRAGRGRNAIYELPWFLVMGRPAAGKTVAIKNSGLGLPVKKDWVKGVGGTYTCDWFFTNDMIFLDTPGKWVTDGFENDAQKYWKKLLQLLRKYRGRQPLDGLIVTVPADDLLSLSEQALIDQATNIREVVELIHEELNFRFPVYLLITKADLVEGFVDFSSALPAQRRHEILGWSSPDPNQHDVAGLIDRGFNTVQRRLENYRLEMLGRVARRTQARRLFLFTEEFKELRDPLITFAEGFFHGDRYHEPPVFRGFYFTSGTQGEGSPLSRAMTGLAQSLGVTPPRADSDGEETKRSYFLLDMFRELMVKDDGLVGRTATHWWKQRRNTMLGAFAPAGLAIALLLFSLVSFFLNRNVYRAVERDAPAIASSELLDDLASRRQALTGENVLGALDLTGLLRDEHRKLSVWSPFRSLGMRRPGPLTDSTYAVFEDRFREAILRPLLEDAEELASEPAGDCVARVDLLHSVVWLRMGRRFETSDDLSGLEQLWDLKPAVAAEARDELIRQFAYFERHSAGEGSSLLPGFSIRRVAQSIKDDCDSEGATSTLAQYLKFEQDCRLVRTSEEIEECYGRLSEVLNTRQIDFERFTSHFKALKSDLEKLQDEESQAAEGLRILDPMQLGTQETSQCLIDFEQKVIPEVDNYAAQEDLLQACKDAVDAAPDSVAKFQARDLVLQAQAEARKEQAELLQQDLATYSLSCRGIIEGFRNLNFPLLQSVTTSYRRAACLPLGGPRVEVAPAATGPVVQPTRKASTRGQRSPYRFISVGGSPGYSLSGFSEKSLEWKARLDARSAGFDASQAAFEESQVRGQIQSYASGVNSGLLRYLGGLSLKRPGGSVENWLQELSATTEFVKALKPAADIGRQALAQTEPPFDGLQTSLAPLVSVARFNDEKLAEYQSLLASISADLAQCSDPGFFAAYKSAVAAGQRSNNLVDARAWVNTHGGAGLASNSLKALLLSPLEEANNFLQSDSFLKGQWAELVSSYSENIAGQAPFAGQLDGVEPVSKEGLIAFFGGASGVVRRVREAAAGGGLSGAADSWLSNAEAIAGMLFEPGSDRLQDIPIRFSIDETQYDPEELANKNKIIGVWLHVGGDDDLKFEGEGNPSKRLGVPIFADYAYVSGNISQKKGLIKRTVGKNWKEPEFEPFVEEQGPFAPLRLILGGLQGNAASGELALQFVKEVPWKKSTGTFKIKMRASGDGLPELIQILQRGMLAPPAAMSGN